MSEIEAGKRAALYVRVSKNREGDRAKPDRQIDTSMKIAEARDYVLVHEVFKDDDVSAFKGKTKRPEYEALTAVIEAGEVDVVLCWHIDRLLRTTKEMLKFIDLAERTGVRLESVQGGDLDLGTPSGRMVATILASVAQQEVELKSERHLNKNRQTRAAGGSTGGPTPFGWECSDGALHEVEGPLLAKATTNIIEGRTLSEIAREWNAAGVRTTFSNEWNHNSLKKVLVRPRNAGLIDHNGIVVEGVHARWEPAVSVDEWRAAKVILDAQRRPATPPRHMLSGLLTCGVCGNRMVAGIATSKIKDKRYSYEVYKHQGVKGCGATIRREVTDKAVRSHVRHVLINMPVETLAPETADLKRAVALRGEQADITAKLAELEELFTAGEFSASGYRKARAGLVETLESVSDALADIAKGNAFASLLGASIGVEQITFKGAVKVGEKFDALDLSQRRLIVKTLFPAITISKGKGADRITMEFMDGKPHEFAEDVEEVA